MSSPGRPGKVKRFRGKTGAECEGFVQSIRETAWNEGMLEDTRWMAHFASLHYSGKALKWHSDLSPDVRQDWIKQEKALLERWPPPDGEGDNEAAERTIIPTPATASLLSRQAGESSSTGVLQFVPISGNGGPVYIAEPDVSGQCELTTELGRALRLQWDRSVNSGSRVLEWVGSGSTWLAIHWMQNDLSFERGSLKWARLTVVDPTTLTPATSKDFPGLRHFRINIWRLSSGGQTTVVWNDGGRALELVVFRNTVHVFFSVDSDATQKANPNEIQGRLLFKSIE